MLAACRVDDDVPDPVVVPPLDLSSQYYTDVNNQRAGQSGTPEDFQQEDWESWVQTLFDDLDTASLPSGTANDIERVSLFPNPAQTQQVMFTQGLDTVNVKLVLVNKDRTPLWKASRQIAGASSSNFAVLDYSAVSLGQDSLFRLYYAFSTQDSPYFHTSHADVTLRR